jgi:hypothetical protein
MIIASALVKDSYLDSYLPVGIARQDVHSSSSNGPHARKHVLRFGSMATDIQSVDAG